MASLPCFQAKLHLPRGQLVWTKFQRLHVLEAARSTGVGASTYPLVAIITRSTTTSTTCDFGSRTKAKPYQNDSRSMIFREFKQNFRRQSIRSYSSSNKFPVSKVLVVPKTTRYMFEKQRFGGVETEERIRQRLMERGSDLDFLKDRHRVHTDNTERCKDILTKLGLETRTVDRYHFNDDAVRWADLIVSMGGDGTFLLAASKVLDQTPVIGVNTDPQGSEGHLCLPNRYTFLFEDALKRILSGDFRWMRRQRIRVTVDGCMVNKDPIDLHELELSFPEHYHTHSQQERRMHQGLDCMVKGPRVLPVRALNEIFIGESLSSRMSYYEMSVDDGPMEKQKSSGVTVSTGTGSSSWSFNINKLSCQSVKDILKITNEETGSNLATEDSTVERIADRFNSSLLFDGADPRMAYTVRDPVTNRVYQSDMPRGFARKIVMRSRCWDASLVIDAGSSFIFNDGAIATMEINEKDALNTIELVD
ncbi:NAD kinase 2, mitochondrial-like isoform X2 [Lytechinus variegatus]|uniref:NAD kinase 2, mitochondrial-like isoform X2 n=1 Tax=Lytechinus variegatus TaxID=7654 RepID=UPI001BB15392|nr:NAD kinase 2, mitochondrial-like isoform X2 [Lytechinus variegatus]